MSYHELLLMTFLSMCWESSASPCFLHISAVVGTAQEEGKLPRIQYGQASMRLQEINLYLNLYFMLIISVSHKSAGVGPQCFHHCVPGCPLGYIGSYLLV